jgi:hypothetical protein
MTSDMTAHCPRADHLIVMAQSAPATVSAMERVLAELDASLPFIPRDLLRLIAQYARVIGADFDLDTCLVAVPAKFGDTHGYRRPEQPQPSTAALRSCRAAPMTIVTMHMATGNQSHRSRPSSGKSSAPNTFANDNRTESLSNDTANDTAQRSTSTATSMVAGPLHLFR